MEEELAIGIDLGTTNSCVAVVRNERVEIIPNEIGENLTPSVVSFTENGVLVGEETANEFIKNPKNTIYSIKRLMGRNYDEKEVLSDINSNFWTFDIVKQKTGQRPMIKIEKEKNKYDYYFPEAISKFILEKLLKSTRNYLDNILIKKAVITVPAYFNNAQREATKLAAKEAGLEVLRIINEPTAASLAYGLEKKIPKKNILMNSFFEKYQTIKTENNDNDELMIVVFDLGGGTFDVSLLKIEDEEIFNVIATSGNSHLGGDDFDKKIIDYCLEDFCNKYNINKKEIEKDTQAMNRLKFVSEKAKIKLSSENETIIEIDNFYNNQMLHIKLTRQKFEDICSSLFYKLLGPLDKVFDDSQLSPSNINEIVLVGGSSRMPKVKEMIKNYFFDVNINDSINPDETVAYGAAIQAAKLMKQGSDILDDVILMDITPFSLGINIENKSENEEIKNKGSLMSVIIPRYSNIPIKKTGNYQTAFDFQTTIRIGVYEGEQKYVKDNHLLGEFSLVNLPKKKAGEVKDNVTFNIDANGILTVTAVETSKNITNSIKIINDKGFNKDEIIENLNQTFINLIGKDNKEFKNYKKEMKDYYKFYTETYDNDEKYKYIYNFSETVFNFLNSFDKEGNETLGNKYFLYIKVLFQAYRTLITLTKNINDTDKNLIINNSKNFLKILSTFNNTNYKTYIELLNQLKIPYEKNTNIQLEKKINEERNLILYDIVLYSMELLQEKAEKILKSNQKFSRYNSRYLFQNCLHISELFICSERELAKQKDLKERYDKCIEKCKNEIKKINAKSLVEIDKIKNSSIIIKNGEKMEREDLLILLDNYREALQNIKELENYELEAIILANIIKINYKYLNNDNYEKLRNVSEHVISLAKQANKNLEQSDWFLEINEILQELNIKLEEKEKLNQENFEEKYIKENKNIFDEINKYKKKSNIEFIEFILNKYPPKKSPLRKNLTVKEQWNKDSKSFIEILSARYHPDNYSKKKTNEEKLKYTIYHTISTEINLIKSKLNQNIFELEEL